jgi:hypothetical protein
MSDKRDEKQNDMSNRLANRFDDETDNTDNLDKPDNIDNTDNEEQLANSDNTNNRSDIDPKEDWTGRMVYVPDGDGQVDDLLNAFDGEYDRMQYETDWDVRKQRHYYPVLIQVGIDELQSMSGDDFTDVVDTLGLR